MIHGAQDPQFSVQLRQQLKALRPDTELLILPDASHSLPTYTEELAAKLGTVATASIKISH